jgi:hypothetical protein
VKPCDSGGLISLSRGQVRPALALAGEVAIPPRWGVLGLFVFNHQRDTPMRPPRSLFVILAGLSIALVDATPASAGCYCSGADMDGVVPLEGLFLLPQDSCANESRSMWVTDEEGLGVSGSIDTTIEAFPGTDAQYWLADAPLTPGTTHKYYHVLKDGSRDFNSYGCETTASLTALEGPFPAMVEPLAEMTELTAIWVPRFGCYAPRYRVTVIEDPAPGLAPYHRYTISVVRGEEATPAKWQVGGPPEVFDHYADWSTGWMSDVPYQDAYCIRVEAWEIVNGTKTSEDFCVLPEDLVGATTVNGVPDETVPADAGLCDASVDLTDPIIDPPPNDPPPNDGDPADDGGCSQGQPSGGLPALLLTVLLALGMRRRPEQA